ncbi:hypothetical protein ATB99_10940 [Elizabethkingia meningoseptica]|uniref:hypothetical protein n=1 Tax=Elizabethkingia meningoseptica TaxID=238 RepID=UPI00036B3D35|nr:hypothetical protein [Elizabethkingia meningoseptica]AQX06879.1 hypothetical protein BBD33_17130 [Elizabethkingia meningoseptica]AQX48925.1 hypothetical protein B5G46_17115 [Elizabethkingia meningoseptica]KUY15011.1 hypothetical protein ATB99_10940 [Elizabethkingia meningoseptica]MCL1674229.1 hypothetical protein [Elizabethkingia meningoseptica]MCL1685130.1 hypothetical protein [Elizabethkingia meningoseptica]
MSTIKRNSKINKRIIYFFIFLFLISCKKEETLLIKQHLIYDSYNSKDNSYSLRLRSIILFDKAKAVERKDFNNFYIIIDKDTIPLIPVSNKNIIRKEHDSLKIEYISYLFLNEVKYDNPQKLRLIKNSLVKKYSDNNSIRRASNYSISSTITINSLGPTGDVVE